LINQNHYLEDPARHLWAVAIVTVLVCGLGLYLKGIGLNEVNRTARGKGQYEWASEETRAVELAVGRFIGAPILLQTVLFFAVQVSCAVALFHSLRAMLFVILCEFAMILSILVCIPELFFID